ncbi:MAG: TylF/MycF/NovP-related O-methyltransferase [Bryobacteraceae bacterium]|nr:TylF/MycF/NovP-related O-methyltransferase [Bryobacteraceae bacterium]
MSLSLNDRYLELLKNVLVRAGFPDNYGRLEPWAGPRRRKLLDPLQAALHKGGLELVKAPDPRRSLDGPAKDTNGETMMGLPRLQQLHDAVRTVLAEEVPGDFLEAGVWRGGGTIFLRAALAAYGVTDRRVWVADSFQGIPPPDAGRYPADSGAVFHQLDYFAVPLEAVQQNFERFGLLDDQVRFLKGWFKDTLPTAPIDSLAILRVDGDSYESTMDALQWLYPKVVPGGFVIVDDYGSVEACRKAVTDFGETYDLPQTFNVVDDTEQSCVWWRR